MLGQLSALSQISLFFASMVVLYLIFRVLERMLTRKNGNGNGHLTIQNLLESEERLMEDMRALADARMLTVIEKVTDPIVTEIRGLRDDLASRRRYSDSK